MFAGCAAKQSKPRKDKKHGRKPTKQQRRLPVDATITRAGPISQRAAKEGARLAKQGPHEIFMSTRIVRPRSGSRGRRSGSTVVVRERPVTFGNPSLGTYEGSVYTLERRRRRRNDNNSTDDDATDTDDSDDGGGGDNGEIRRPDVIVEGATAVQGNNGNGDSNLVAMVRVPPEQVPEGVLNAARSHRPWIKRVRIVIEEEPEEAGQEEEGGADGSSGGGVDEGKDGSHERDRFGRQHSTASILSTTSGRTYLVLFEMSDAKSARQLVRSLHGQPYTFLDETEVCSVYPVAALKGQGGVSLMSPFFASSSTGCATTATTASAAAAASSSAATAAVAMATGEAVAASATTAAASDGDKAVQVLLATAAAAVSAGAGTAAATSDTALTAAVPVPATAQRHRPNQDDSHMLNCAVCLEHMKLDRAVGTADKQDGDDVEDNYEDESGDDGSEWTSIITTVCNHSFHVNCLLQWQDSPCPVCRYDHSGLNKEALLSQCHVCQSTGNNFVCLICGVVSCCFSNSVGGGGAEGLSNDRTRFRSATFGEGSGQVASDCARWMGAGAGSLGGSSTPLEPPSQPTSSVSSTSHAHQHYDETLHAYALDTESQHVWDFAGQGYVHRLLQNKDDGKLVEAHDPNNNAGLVAADSSHVWERSLNPGLSDAQEGEVVHRKLEGFASQYYTLLKSQLEQQRIYFEGRLAEIRREHGVAEEKDDADRAPEKRASDLIAALKQERNQLSQRLASLQGKRTKVRSDVAFLESMNSSLQANKGLLKKQLQEAQQERANLKKALEQDERIPQLQQKVTSLMLQLE